MAQPINRYKADLREFAFVAFEQFKLGELLGKEPYEAWGEEECKASLQEAYRYATEVAGPLNALGDQQGCTIVDGRVKVPDGFAECWKQLYALGLKSMVIPEEYGGVGAPSTIAALVNEMCSGANTAFDMYPGLTVGAADLVESFGTPEQRDTYCQKMFDGTYAGTMCLTEPQAGSDVGMASTAAKKLPNGKYAIKGTKLFISGGDHDMAENVIHLLLARIEGAQKGTRGLSLFIVPRHRVDSGEPNDVKVAAIEHKMGINGSATCMLSFGEDDACEGELVGTQEHVGIRQMFQMMNFARLGVGMQGLAIASTAYLNALEYARERKQGSSIDKFKDPEAPRVPIIEHADVRRMLLDMKARVEGVRALIMKGVNHVDRARIATGKDDAQVAYHSGQLELITPLIKAYSSDQAFHVCETAIQTFGGVGFTRDFPVEQYARDSKIFSIYEGTNHIQSLDLVARKLNQAGGQNMQNFLNDISEFVAKNQEDSELGASVKKLAGAHEAVTSCAMQFMQWVGAGELGRVPVVSTRFLELMSELAVGWLLLDAAVIAKAAQANTDPGHPDHAFYEGKKAAGVYYAHAVLSEAKAKAATICECDMSPTLIPDAAFASL